MHVPSVSMFWNHKEQQIYNAQTLQMIFYCSVALLALISILKFILVLHAGHCLALWPELGKSCLWFSSRSSGILQIVPKPDVHQTLLPYDHLRESVYPPHFFSEKKTWVGCFPKLLDSMQTPNLIQQPPCLLRCVSVTANVWTWGTWSWILFPLIHSLTVGSEEGSPSLHVTFVWYRPYFRHSNTVSSFAQRLFPSAFGNDHFSLILKKKCHVIMSCLTAAPCYPWGSEVGIVFLLLVHSSVIPCSLASGPTFLLSLLS